MHAKTLLTYLVNRLNQENITKMIEPYESNVALENIFE